MGQGLARSSRLGLPSFLHSRSRVGAGDTRSGYSGMVVPPSSTSAQPTVDMDKVNIQNWTVTHGLASPQEILALELGLYRTALKRIRSSSLVVDKCGVSCLRLQTSLLALLLS